MDVTRFGIFLGVGVLNARTAGNNFWILFAYLFISVLVGLNPQRPGDSQNMIDSFMGLIAGMFVGALVSRLIWPVLPQRLLRDNLLDLFAGIRALLPEDPHQERIKAQLAIRSVEAQQAIHGIRVHGFTEKEKTGLSALLR